MGYGDTDRFYFFNFDKVIADLPGPSTRVRAKNHKPSLLGIMTTK